MITLLHAAQEAMCWFIKLWSSMNSFGMEFISCSNMETREKGIIGVSKNKVRQSVTTVLITDCLAICVDCIS